MVLWMIQIVSVIFIIYKITSTINNYRVYKQIIYSCIKSFTYVVLKICTNDFSNEESFGEAMDTNLDGCENYFTFHNLTNFV